MNNLTQTQADAKRAYLDRQAEQMLAHYQTTNQSERTATIKQIDNFLTAVPKEARIFWLKFRYKLERMNGKLPSKK